MILPALNAAWLGSSPAALLASVADAHRITVQELCGPRRFRLLMPARRQAASLLWQRGLTLKEIGRHLRRRHSTVHGLLNGRRISRPPKERDMTSGGTN